MGNTTSCGKRAGGSHHRDGDIAIAKDLGRGEDLVRMLEDLHVSM